MATAPPFRIAGPADAWCGRCKLMLRHTVETLDGGRPDRVHCNTCKSQHGYKPYAPGDAPRQVKERRERATRGARAPQPGHAKASHYDALISGRDQSQAASYSPKGRFQPGDVISHPTFGVGVATALKDTTKIEVLFPEGPKVLIHGR
jgi:hypothetical protein